MTAITNLLELDPDALMNWCQSNGEKAFRARQLQRWIHQFGQSDFDAMTDLAKSLRDKLRSLATVTAPAVISDHTSSDGTRKWLFDVGHGNAVETVFIPEDNRGTLCVSTQAGCAVNCRFCSTGKQGFSRNLSVANHRAIVGSRVHAPPKQGYCRWAKRRAPDYEGGLDGNGRAPAQLRASRSCPETHARR